MIPFHSSLVFDALKPREKHPPRELSTYPAASISRAIQAGSVVRAGAEDSKYP